MLSLSAGKSHIGDDLDMIERVYKSIGNAHPQYNRSMKYKVTVKAFRNKLICKLLIFSLNFITLCQSCNVPCR